MIRLPPELATPVSTDGSLLYELLLDLVAYLPDASLGRMESLVAWYQRLCPPERFLRYKQAERFGWDSIADPDLSKEGRAARDRGEPDPYLAPVRRRIAEGRPFELRFWDGRIGQAFGFSHWRVNVGAGQLRTFVRVTLPLDFPLERLIDVARELVDQGSFLSGHGGLVFGYDTDRKFDAFTAIYTLARRYWGIDVEDLNATLPFMNDAIKGVQWLTLIGARFIADPAAERAIAVASSQPDMHVEHRVHGLLLRLGTDPDPGDRHRPNAAMAPYFALGGALRPLIVRGVPTFSGKGFTGNDNTDGWLHRFDEPAGWR